MAAYVCSAACEKEDEVARVPSRLISAKPFPDVSS